MLGADDVRVLKAEVLGCPNVAAMPANSEGAAEAVVLSVVSELVDGAPRLLNRALELIVVVDEDVVGCDDELLRKLKGDLGVSVPDAFCPIEPNAGVLCPCVVVVAILGPVEVFSVALFAFWNKPPVDCDPAIFPKAFLEVPSVSRCLMLPVPRNPVEEGCPRLLKGFEDAPVEPDSGAEDCVLF